MSKKKKKYCGKNYVEIVKGEMMVDLLKEGFDRRHSQNAISSMSCHVNCAWRWGGESNVFWETEINSENTTWIDDDDDGNDEGVKLSVAQWVHQQQQQQQEQQQQQQHREQQNQTKTKTKTKQKIMFDIIPFIDCSILSIS